MSPLSTYTPGFGFQEEQKRKKRKKKGKKKKIKAAPPIHCACHRAIAWKEKERRGPQETIGFDHKWALLLRGKKGKGEKKKKRGKREGQKRRSLSRAVVFHSKQSGSYAPGGEREK